VMSRPCVGVMSCSGVDPGGLVGVRGTDTGGEEAQEIAGIENGNEVQSGLRVKVRPRAPGRSIKTYALRTGDEPRREHES